VAAATLAVLCAGGVASAAPVYLNSSNITVALGPSMSPNPFANVSTANSLANIIDAPSATAGELHTQSTHVWVSGGTLELVFDFGVEYDLSDVHFWNYHSEGFDVDDISFEFFNAANVSVGTLAFSPLLGNNTGSDSTPIFAESYALAFPSNVQFVTAVLSGTNNQVDFNNIGFTAQLSNPDPDPDPVPEPTTMALFALALACGVRARRR
jgi:hypothetical protein